MTPKIDAWWMLRNWRFIAGAYWAALHGWATNYRGWLTLEEFKAKYGVEQGRNAPA